MTYITRYSLNISRFYQKSVEFDSITENTRISHAMLAYREVSTYTQSGDQQFFSTRQIKTSYLKESVSAELVSLKNVVIVTRTTDFYMSS